MSNPYFEKEDIYRSREHEEDDEFSNELAPNGISNLDHRRHFSLVEEESNNRPGGGGEGEEVDGMRRGQDEGEDRMTFNPFQNMDKV